MQETKVQLEANKEKFLTELNELKEGIAPLEADLKEKEDNKNEIVKKNRYVCIDQYDTSVAKYFVF